MADPDEDEMEIPEEEEDGWHDAAEERHNACPHTFRKVPFIGSFAPTRCSLFRPREKIKDTYLSTKIDELLKTSAFQFPAKKNRG